MSAPADAEVGTRFRRAAARFPTGVTVLTTLADGVPHGMTANSFTSVSLDPLLVQVSVRNGSATHRHIVRAGAFAVTVLAEGQQDLALWFASSRRPTGAAAFADVAWTPGPATGAPVLSGGISYFDCVIDAAHRTGDHTTLVGAVRAFDVLSDDLPLLFLGSGFARLPEPTS